MTVWTLYNHGPHASLLEGLEACGILLGGVGAAAACVKIAHTVSQQERNEILDIVTLWALACAILLLVLVIEFIIYFKAFGQDEVFGSPS